MKYFLIAWIGILGLSTITSAQDILKVTNFGELKPGDNFTEEWYTLEFRNTKHTDYSLVSDDNGKTVVEANSENAASGLIREVDIDPSVYKYIQFRWKIEDIIASGDVTERSGDDYPARIYITFDIPMDSLSGPNRIALNTARAIYGREQLPTRAMNYIWANKAETGSFHPNPWTRLSQMVVVESGTERAGEWVTVTRNIFEDYKEIFGSEPPRINSIAIMTDSDNTGEIARAWYSDIVFFKDKSLAEGYREN